MTIEELIEISAKYRRSNTIIVNRLHLEKLLAVAKAAKWLNDHVNRDYAEWKEPLEQALAELEQEEKAGE